eukprot:GHVN01069851.1.p1 GENE.GHVN01069851.1~~GHVN01069851.1.p1  ORF type:complete len:1287 (+),score=204.31 GHVN01069851.1:3239-7099(+)
MNNLRVQLSLPASIAVVALASGPLLGARGFPEGGYLDNNAVFASFPSKEGWEHHEIGAESLPADYSPPMWHMRRSRNDKNYSAASSPDLSSVYVLTEDDILGIILFFIVALFMASLCSFFISLLPAYRPPESIAWFLLGLSFYAIHYVTGADSLIAKGVDAVAFIDHNVVYLVLLPILLYEATQGLNMHKFLVVLPAGLTLAVFGVIFQIALLSLLNFYSFLHPLGHSVLDALLLSTALSSTDPVAVISVLRSLNAPDKLSSVFDVESLINDGVSVSFFSFFMILRQPGTVGGGAIIVTFIKLMLLGPPFGVACSIVVTFWLKWFHGYDLLQVVGVVSGGYIVWFVAEEYLGLSGPLAIVSYGLYFASRGKFAFEAHVQEAHHHFVEGVATLANSSIFIITGVLVARILFVTGTTAPIATSKIWHSAPLYFYLNFARFVMVLVFLPVLQHTGYGFGWKENTLLAWGGLRGAIVLALALLIEGDLDGESDGGPRELLVLYIATSVLLVLVINGISFELVYTLLNPYPTKPFRQVYLGKTMTLIDRQYDEEMKELQHHWAFRPTRVLDYSAESVPTFSGRKLNKHGKISLSLPNVRHISWRVSRDPHVIFPSDYDSSQVNCNDSCCAWLRRHYVGITGVDDTGLEPVSEAKTNTHSDDAEDDVKGVKRVRIPHMCFWRIDFDSEPLWLIDSHAHIGTPVHTEGEEGGIDAHLQDHESTPMSRDVSSDLTGIQSSSSNFFRNRSSDQSFTTRGPAADYLQSMMMVDSSAVRKAGIGSRQTQGEEVMGGWEDLERADSGDTFPAFQRDDRPRPGRARSRDGSVQSAQLTSRSASLRPINSLSVGLDAPPWQAPPFDYLSRRLSEAHSFGSQKTFDLFELQSRDGVSVGGTATIVPVLRSEREGELYLMVFNTFRRMYYDILESGIIEGGAAFKLNDVLDNAIDWAIGKMKKNHIMAWEEALHQIQALDQKSGRYDGVVRRRKKMFTKMLSKEDDQDENFAAITAFDVEYFELERHLHCMKYLSPARFWVFNFFCGWFGAMRCCCVKNKPKGEDDYERVVRSVTLGEAIRRLLVAICPFKSLRRALTYHACLSDVGQIIAFTDVHEELLLKGGDSLKNLMGNHVYVSYVRSVDSARRLLTFVEDAYRDAFPLVMHHLGVSFALNIKRRLTKDLYHKGLMLEEDFDELNKILARVAHNMHTQSVKREYECVLCGSCLSGEDEGCTCSRCCLGGGKKDGQPESDEEEVEMGHRHEKNGGEASETVKKQRKGLKEMSDVGDLCGGIQVEDETVD